jgi:hypothetical protein
MEATSPTKRRTLLQRALALLAGSAGLGLAGKKAAEAGSNAPSRGTFKLYARRWAVRAHEPSSNDRVVSYGELLGAPDGAKLGEVQTTCFCMDSAFGPNLMAASNLEFQTLRLEDGILFGLGAPGEAPEGAKARAILGGTGKYAGSRGSYVERTLESQRGADGLVEFTLTVTA